MKVPRLVAQLPLERVRQHEQLADLNLVTSDDRFFFQVCPERKYRVRPVTPVEIEEIAVMGEKAPLAPACCTLFAVIHNVAPGARERTFAFAECENDINTDVIAEHLLSCLAVPFVILEIDNIAGNA